MLNSAAWHAVLAVKAVRAALRAVLRESAAPSLDGCAAAFPSGPWAIPPEENPEKDNVESQSFLSRHQWQIATCIE